MSGLALCLLLPLASLAQEAEPIRIAVTNTDISEYGYRDKKQRSGLLREAFNRTAERLQTFGSVIVRSFATDDRYLVIDRSSITELDAERERQRSIDYIDGYTVDQGRLEGVSYILQPAYKVIDNSLNVRVLDVATNQVTCEASARAKDPKRIQTEEVQQLFSTVIAELNQKCFARTFPVVRITDRKKDKVREVLTAMGRAANLTEESEVGFFTTEQLEVDGRTMQRENRIASGKVEKVEDDNFSLVRISDGHAVLGTAIDAGTRVYVKIEKL